MRTTLPHLLVALLLVSQTACTTVSTTSDDRRPVTRSATRVEVAADGRPSLEGDTLSVAALARRLKREGPRRAIALHGAVGCTQASLIHLQRELVRQGLPNVSIVTARRATAEVSEDPEETVVLPPTDDLPAPPLPKRESRQR